MKKLQIFVYYLMAFNLILSNWFNWSVNSWLNTVGWFIGVFCVLYKEYLENWQYIIFFVGWKLHSQYVRISLNYKNKINI